MLTRARLDELFALRAAAKSAEREADSEFLDRYKFDCFDREAVEIAGRRWVVEKWSELRDVKPAIIAYEEANRTLAAEERGELMELAEWDGGYTPDLDLLLCILETRRQLHTH